jgi:hypothetical protein
MSGTVISTYTTTGVVVSLASQEPILVTSTGTIAAPRSPFSAYPVGIYVRENISGNVTNDGLISGYEGIIFGDGGILDNQGTLIGNAVGISIRASTGSVSTVTNSGTIAGSGATNVDGVGVVLSGGGIIENGSSSDAGGLISGSQDGILVEGEIAVGYHGFDTISNNGTIISTGTNGDAILLQMGLYDVAAVTNGAESVRSALIQGADGVVFYYNGAVGTVTNFGTILGLGTSSGTGVGVRWEGTARLINGSQMDKVALMEGNFRGVSDYNAYAAIVNYGTILATDTASQGLYAFGRITNEGDESLIQGVSFGVLSESATSLYNDGTIRATGSAGIGIALDGGGSLLDSGTISGTKYAIYAFGTLNLTLNPGAVLEGVVDDRQGIGTLVLAGTSAGTLNMGGSFRAFDFGSGFESIGFAAGSSWTLQGEERDFSDFYEAQTITGFARSDIIILNGYAASADNFVAGTGLVLAEDDFYSDDFTLGIVGDFSTADFDVTTDGTSTTIALFDQIGAGNFTVIAGSVLSDPYIASGADVSVQSGGTVSHALIAGGTLELGTGSDVIGDITFSGAGRLIIDGAAPVSNVITGFTAGDTIELAGIPFVGTGGTFGTAGEDTYTIANAGTLTIDADGDIFHLNIPGLTAGQHNLHLSGDLGITETAPCFTAGTRILTAHGEIPVEALGVGDLVVTHEGGLAPVVWIGKRTVDVGRHHRPELVSPVLIQAGALADGVPCQDLAVSPDHAFYLDGHLVPAKTLVNGWTIRWLNVPRVTYYHVELPAHGVLFAEGAAAESYLETGNRCAFENGFGAMRLHPDFAQTMREAEGCAPFAESGAVVEAIRRRILMRARIPVTNNPELRVTYRRDDAVIESRSAIPGEIFADPRDRRRLGVKIAAISTSHGMIALDHPALCDGWHDPEPDGRWTDGHAVVPKSLLRGAQIGEVVLASTLAYPARGWLERLPGRC